MKKTILVVGLGLIGSFPGGYAAGGPFRLTFAGQAKPAQLRAIRRARFRAATRRLSFLSERSAAE